MSGQKLIKNGQVGDISKTWSCGQTKLPDRSLIIGQKLVKNAEIQKLFDILSGQKLIKNAKKSNLATFWKSKICCQKLLPDRSILSGQKLAKNSKYEKFQMRHFE